MTRETVMCRREGVRRKGKRVDYGVGGSGREMGRRGEERERKGKERKGKERKGKERKRVCY